MKSDMVMTNNKPNLRGFQTAWIRFNKHNTHKHQLFFKEHSVRKQEPEYPRGKTLFVLNVPPYVTTVALQHAFSNICGNVENVTFATSEGFKTAYIVFEKESALENALELPEGTIVKLNAATSACVTGLTKWCRRYNDSLHDEEITKKQIEQYMNDYDNQVADRIAREKAAEEAEQNDGWVTVTARKKRGQFALSRKESTINKVQNKEEQKNKKKQLLNFYTFQIRESKKQNLAELRKKFELDKKRLQELKQKRTFKPF